MTDQKSRREEEEEEEEALLLQNISNDLMMNGGLLAAPQPLQSFLSQSRSDSLRACSSRIPMAMKTRGNLARKSTVRVTTSY